MTRLLTYFFFLIPFFSFSQEKIEIDINLNCTKDSDTAVVSNTNFIELLNINNILVDIDTNKLDITNNLTQLLLGETMYGDGGYIINDNSLIGVSENGVFLASENDNIFIGSQNGNTSLFGSVDGTQLSNIDLGQVNYNTTKPTFDEAILASNMDGITYWLDINAHVTNLITNQLNNQSSTNNSFIDLLQQDDLEINAQTNDLDINTLGGLNLSGSKAFQIFTSTFGWDDAMVLATPNGGFRIGPSTQVQTWTDKFLIFDKFGNDTLLSFSNGINGKNLLIDNLSNVLITVSDTYNEDEIYSPYGLSIVKDMGVALGAGESATIYFEEGSGGFYTENEMELGTEMSQIEFDQSSITINAMSLYFNSLRQPLTNPFNNNSVWVNHTNGDGNWMSLEPLSGSGIPTIAPRMNGDRYFDFTNNNWYQAYDNENGDGTGDGFDADDWIKLN
jgi:hypothetical protein